MKFVDKEHMKKGMESDDTRVGEDSELEFFKLTQSTEMREAEYSVRRVDSRMYCCLSGLFLYVFPYSS